MKILRLIPLMFLTACSTTPKLTLRPQRPPSAANNAAVRYPDTVRSYHFGRYVDPNDSLVMHEKHVIYRVEENSRWDLHPKQADNATFQFTPPRDAAFAPAPANDAILAEVNAQKLATGRIMAQTKDLASALARFQTALQQTSTNFQEIAILRASVVQMKKQLDALETTRILPLLPPSFPTNEPSDSLEP
jgi:hypothetical protein